MTDTRDIELGDEAPRRGGRRWQQIAEDILAEIEAGAVPPGGALPTVMSLAERFQVNRHTVRQALQFLQSRGHVSVEQGRGTFVQPRKFDYRLGQRVRFGSNFEALGIAISSSLVSSGVEPLSGHEAAALRMAEGTPAWTFRVLRIVDKMPLSTSLHRLPVARFPGLDAHFETVGLSVTAMFQRFGISDYVRVETRIETAMPTDEEQDWLQMGPHRPVLLTTGIDGLPGTREPFHITSTTFVGDRVELVL